MIALLHTRRAFQIILALGLFTMAARNVSDPDVWWHLRTGELTIQNHAVFHTDPYSFTRFGQPWVNHEWLSDILIFGLYRVASWSGLIVVFALIVAAANFLAFLRCPGSPYVSALITVWGAVASAPLWGVRPQAISLLLASVFLLILERSGQRPRLVWWLPPLMLIWVNFHAGYAIGIALLVLFLIGNSLDAALGWEDWPEAAPHLRRLAVILIACVAVVPLNPSGVRMFWYPFETLHSAAMQSYINEWFSPNFHELRYLPLLAMLLAFLALFAVSPQRVRPRELVLLLVTMAAALRSVRHIPIFVLVAVPLLSRLVQAWLQERRPGSRLPGRVPMMRRTLVMNAIVLAAFLVFTVVRVGYVMRGQAQAEAREFPAAAADFLARERPQAPILNHYNWGGYFIWKLYPQYRVFIDGRADLYGDLFLDDFAATYYLTDHWRASLESWGIRTIILPPDAPLLTALRSKPEWKLIYSDSVATVLTRTGLPDPLQTAQERH